MNCQDSSRQPGGRRVSGRAPYCPGDHQATKGVPMFWRPPSDQEGAWWPGRRLGAEWGEKAAIVKRAQSSQGGRITEGLKQPGGRRRASNGEGRFVDALLTLWALKSGLGVLEHLQRDIKLQPYRENSFFVACGLPEDILHKSVSSTLHAFPFQIAVTCKWCIACNYSACAIWRLSLKALLLTIQSLSRDFLIKRHEISLNYS